MAPLIGGKDVDDHITQVDHLPTVSGLAFDLDMPAQLFFSIFSDGFSQRLEHAVAGSIAKDEIISEGCDFVNIQQQDLFCFFILKYGYDFVRFFQGFQISPQIKSYDPILTYSFMQLEKGQG